MKYQKVISIGAHSLDAELMGGPLMIKYAQQGAHCTFCHVTMGRLEDPQATEAEKLAYLKQIQQENTSSAAVMGCDVRALGYRSSELPGEEEFIKLMMEYLRAEQADLVITHARGTLHPRHYYTYYTVTEAVKRLRAQGQAVNLLYGENCEDLIGFTPTLYTSITEEQKQLWFDGLGQYSLFQGKVNDMPYRDYYQTMGKIRAVEADAKTFVKAYMHAPLIDNE